MVLKSNATSCTGDTLYDNGPRAINLDQTFARACNSVGRFRAKRIRRRRRCPVTRVNTRPMRFSEASVFTVRRAQSRLFGSSPEKRDRSNRSVSVILGKNPFLRLTVRTRNRSHTVVGQLSFVVYGQGGFFFVFKPCTYASSINPRRARAHTWTVFRSTLFFSITSSNTHGERAGFQTDTQRRF